MRAPIEVRLVCNPTPGGIGDGAAAVWIDGNERTPSYKPRAYKNLPAHAAQDLAKEGLACLIQWELKVRGNPSAVEVIVYVAPDVSGCDLVGILL